MEVEAGRPAEDGVGIDTETIEDRSIAMYGIGDKYMKTMNMMRTPDDTSAKLAISLKPACLTFTASNNAS